ncbi:MAG: sigma-70 family RNA polymerase sigma factor [Planctomycetota bacterium]|jgi:RNA polymerase sigma-70 factor (ECF subfamily)
MTEPSLSSLLEHGDFVRRLAKSLVRDPHRADDLEQQTWLAVLERPPRHDANVRAWLARVMRNLAGMTRRGERRRAAREQVVARPEADAPGPEDVVARLEWQRRLVTAVRDLEEPYRSTIVFRYFEQLDPAGIAERMGVPRKTVYTRLSRGLDRLRARFDGETPGGRRAWCLALLPLAMDPPLPLPAAGAAADRAGGLGLPAAVATTVGLVAASLLVGWSIRPAVELPETSPETSRAPTPETRAPSAPPPRVESSDEALIEEFRTGIQEAADDYLCVMPWALRLVQLPPEHGWRVTRAVFPAVSPYKRIGILKGHALFLMHRYELPILHLAATDPAPSVRAAAFRHLNRIAFRDLSGDTEAYLAWYERNRGRSLADVVKESAREFVEALRTGDAEEVGRRLRTTANPIALRRGKLAPLDLPDLMKSAGLLAATEDWLAGNELRGPERNTLHAWIRNAEPDEAFLRRFYLPALADIGHARFAPACLALGDPRHGWALPALLEAYRRAVHRSHFEVISEALGRLGDLRAVPTMIAVLAADDSPRTHDAVGYGLFLLTKVRLDPLHDGAWWRAWFDKNRARLPDDAPATLPQVPLQEPPR